VKIQHVDPAELTPADYNPRSISEHQAEALKRSLDRWGFVEPIVANKRTGRIVGGHQRLDGALALALPKVPVHWIDVDESSEKALNIALNKISGDWDEDLLGKLLADLERDGQDLEDLGFDADELQEIIDAAAPEPELSGDLDAIPEPPAEPITQPGDLWQLGEHRLLCGDSTKAEDVARLMGGAKVDLCFTSPPYGQQRDYDDASDVSDWGALMQGVFSAFDNAMASDAQVLVNLGLIHKEGEWQPYWDGWIEWMRGQGWKRFGFYVWDQGSGMPRANHGRLGSSHEFVFHFCKKPRPSVEWVACKMAGHKRSGKGQRNRVGEVLEWNGSGIVSANKKADSVIRVSRNSGSDGHPAQFPVGLPAEAIRSWPGVIFEPFSGSGTTILAAEQEGSQAYAMEISPAYCDVAVQRWEQATGRKAERVV
jgi:DNA modification methylase